jgi:hypothetical protein
MELIYVDSTNVEQIGYDERERELHVIFKSGRHYIYSDVPEEVYRNFIDASSKGTYLNSTIKNSYLCREI